MMKLWQIALVSTAMGITLPALAQMAQTPPETRAGVEARVKERLGRMDANKDGTVSSDEMRTFGEARMKEHADERFAAMDTNKDGVISRAEFDAARAKGLGMGERIVRLERREGPDGAAPPPPPGAPDGPPRMDRMRIMMKHHDGAMIMADGDGKGIVIADAVKRALERFDATDTNKDGTISPEERKAGREAMRIKMRTMVPPPAPPKAG